MRARLSVLSPIGRYRWILRKIDVGEVVDGDYSRFLTPFGGIHPFEGRDVVLVTGFEEAEYILNRDELFPKLKQVAMDPYDHLLLASAERHAQTSMLIRSCLNKQAFNDSSDWMRNMSSGLLDALPRNEDFDLCRSFAAPVVFYSVCRLFGFDEKDFVAFFQKWECDIDSEELYIDFKAWCFREFQREPLDGDVLMLNALRRQVFSGLMTSDEAVELMLLMFHGALKTTVSLLCRLCMGLLAERPDVMPGLLLEENCLVRFMEETLRVYPIVTLLLRGVSEDTHVSGIKLNKGAKIFLDVASANRDIRRFASGDRISLDSKPQRHLSFGVGMHHCIGMHMARHNVKVIMETLLPRMDSMRLLKSKWIKDGYDSHFVHPLFMICRLMDR